LSPGVLASLERDAFKSLMAYTCGLNAWDSIEDSFKQFFSVYCPAFECMTMRLKLRQSGDILVSELYSSFSIAKLLASYITRQSHAYIHPKTIAAVLAHLEYHIVIYFVILETDEEGCKCQRYISISVFQPFPK
jgi:hypothetical protein